MFDKTIRFVLGDYAIAAEPDLFMHREGAHPTGEMDLRGVRWVSVSESDRDRRLAEATMKRLTGGDTIRARRMRQDFVEFEPSHTPLLITNHLPKVSGDDPAIWRRLRVIPFDVVIPEDEQDKDSTPGCSGGRRHPRLGGRRIPRLPDRGLAEPPGCRCHRDLPAGQRRRAPVRRRRVRDEQDGEGHDRRTVRAHGSEWRSRDGAEPMSQKAFGQALDRLGYPAGDPDPWQAVAEGDRPTGFRRSCCQRRVTPPTCLRISTHSHVHLRARTHPVIPGICSHA